VATRRSSIDIGEDLARRLVVELGREIREGRIDRGLSQSTIGRALGQSKSTVSRIERGLRPEVSIRSYARAFAVLGLELSMRVYPSGEPIRDAGHVRLLARFRARVATRFTWRSEVPIGRGDLRAWDAVLARLGLSVGVEAETRPRDLQALERRIQRKQVDSGIDRVVLLLADTRHNRSLLRDRGADLRLNFPVPGSIALPALYRGDDPGGNAIIVL
jgi:transcriptional regulator with XRE-family HTH domain